MAASTVLDVGGLRIELEPRPSHFDRWFECRIVVDAPPFHGQLATILTDEDLLEFAAALEGLSPIGEAVLGGGPSS